jgi:hypothetical protein
LVALDGSGDGDGNWPVVVVGGALISGLVRAMVVVMARVLRQDPGGVAWVVDQDSVGALGAESAHEPLARNSSWEEFAVVSW